MFKKFISVTVASILLSNSLNASMSDFANGVIEVQDNAGVISTRDRTLLYGGGYTLKVPNVQLTPFTVQAPSIKAGCGGIDMVFGSLGFLDKDQFVRFAEGIVASAPGIAFDLSMKTLCPSCSESIKALQSMANQINNMSLDSCNTATALGNMALDSIVSDTTKEELKGGAVNSFFQGLNTNYLNPATKNLNKFNGWLNSTFTSGATGNSPKIIRYALQTSKPSMIDYFFGNINYFSDGVMLKFLKANIGDIYVVNTPSGENPAILKFHKSLSPLQEYYQVNDKTIIPNAEKLINRLIGAEDNQGYIYNTSYTKEATNTSNFPLGILINRYTTKVETIINKIITRSTLDSNDVKFLGLFKFPVYKIFNILGTNPYTSELLSQSKEKLATMLATQIIYELMITASQNIQMRINELDAYKDKLKGIPVVQAIPNSDGSSELKDFLTEMAKEARLVAGISYVIYGKSYDDFVKNITTGNNLIEQAKRLKQLTISRSNPQMLQQIMYVNSVSTPMK